MLTLRIINYIIGHTKLISWIIKYILYQFVCTIVKVLCPLYPHNNQRTAGFDLYAVFDPLIAKAQAILLGNKLIRWINVRHVAIARISQYTIVIDLLP